MKRKEKYRHPSPDRKEQMKSFYNEALPKENRRFSLRMSERKEKKTFSLQDVVVREMPLPLFS